MIERTSSFSRSRCHTDSAESEDDDLGRIRELTGLENLTFDSGRTLPGECWKREPLPRRHYSP